MSARTRVKIEDRSNATVTYPYTSNVGPNFIQKWYHMLSLCNCTLQARIENISGEKGEEFGEAVILRRGPIVVNDGLKAFNATDRIG